jgi:hypothetical protein
MTRRSERCSPMEPEKEVGSHPEMKAFECFAQRTDPPDKNPSLFWRRKIV